MMSEEQQIFHGLGPVRYDNLRIAVKPIMRSGLVERLTAESRWLTAASTPAAA
jgi:hypothetical protein